MRWVNSCILNVFNYLDTVLVMTIFNPYDPNYDNCK